MQYRGSRNTSTLKGKKWKLRLFTRASSDGTRENGFPLEETKFRLNIREKIFPVRVGEAAQRNCSCQIPEVFKAWLDRAWRSLV